MGALAHHFAEHPSDLAVTARRRHPPPQSPCRGRDHRRLYGADVEGERLGSESVEPHAGAVGGQAEPLGRGAAVNAHGVSPDAALIEVDVVAGVPDHQVVAGFPEHLVIAVAADERVVVGPAGDEVEPGPAEQRVAAGLTEQLVGIYAAASLEDIERTDPATYSVRWVPGPPHRGVRTPLAAKPTSSARPSTAQRATEPPR